ncbi:sigma-70 family RNA polymerase sigma factor [Spongiactinospora sp. 9N601]|uniref:sigma-70 family RNA polymerase sigma factor n=1 Tax=Spongiactinospora sp. 9N601 TaxID=3375149 RepID=UPI003794F9E0
MTTVDDEAERLAARFERDRGHLRAVAYRMLGSLSEADDAVQETWLRLSRTDTRDVANLTAWLTTVVARVCLNLLRSRERRREDPLDDRPLETGGGDPEQEAVLADSVGVALLVVLDTLAPAERLAFVLHDMFAVPFEDIGPMIDRSATAARQLASRARRRVKGAAAPAPDQARRRHVVSAYLAATRTGDFAALISLLHPDVVLHADALAVPTARPVVVRGAQTVAKSAAAAASRAQFTGLALVNGLPGLAMLRHGRLCLVLTFTVTDGLITEIDVIGDPARLAALDLAVPEA